MTRWMWLIGTFCNIGWWLAGRNIRWMGLLGWLHDGLETLGIAIAVSLQRFCKILFCLLHERGRGRRWFCQRRGLYFDSFDLQLL